MAATKLLQGISKAIRAWHGTPHVFKPEPGAPHGRFRDEAIGTGEGAQAFGRGHYLAEERGVAEEYRNRLSNYANDPGAGTLYEANIHADPQSFLDWHQPLSQQSEPTQETLQWLLEPDIAHQNYTRRESLKGAAGNAWRPPMRAEDVARLSKPFDPTGEWAYNALKNKASARVGSTPGPVVATSALKEAGVPGIKFLDQNSRQNRKVLLNGQPVTIAGAQDDAAAIAAFALQQEGSVERAIKFLIEEGGGHPINAKGAELLSSGAMQLAPGTYNFSVFDPKLIEIIGKYGIAGALGMGLISPDQAKAAKAQGYGEPAAPKQGRLPGPQSEAAWFSMKEVPGMIGSSLRETAETTLGAGGDLAEWLGKQDLGWLSKTTIPGMFLSGALPTSEEVKQSGQQLQQQLSPEAQALVSQYTQAQPQSPGAYVAKDVADWTLDPLDMVMGGVPKAYRAIRRLF